MNIFGGMKILWIFFGGQHKIGLYLRVISMHFRVFSQGQGTEWGIFFGLIRFQIFFLVCLKFLIFFGVKGRCWARADLWSTPLGHSMIVKSIFDCCLSSV